MAESNIILHGKYKYKDNSIYRNYITLYPENDTDDVVLGSLTVDIVIRKKDNKEIKGKELKTFNALVSELVNRLNNRAPINIYEKASVLQKSNDIIEENRIVVESDTGGIKIGDGKTRYNLLKYIGSDYKDYKTYILVNDEEIRDIQMILTNANDLLLEQKNLTATEKPIPNNYSRPLIYFEIENLI